MVTIADKFTRLSVNDGDILYGDSNSNDSIEELEDNIDEQMLSYIGSDLTEGSLNNSTTETVIGQVTIAANSANTNLIIIASVEATIGGTAAAYFKVKVGTNGTTADAQIGTTLTLGLTNLGRNGGCMTVVAIEGTDFTGTDTNYVSITGDMSAANGSYYARCMSLIVLGA